MSRDDIPPGPRLPAELLEQIVSELSVPCTYGDPTAIRTLAACALVSRALRHWSLRARYAIVVAPRHVREFRKWCVRSQKEMIGKSSALFVALDDVSKLTSMSAGWDVELIKLLQHQGPHLTQLSLWTSESRVLLRDPAQIRGPRFRPFGANRNGDGEEGAKMAKKDVVVGNAKRRRNVVKMLSRMKQGKLVLGDALSAVPLKSNISQSDQAQTRAEMAAAKERARQTLPRWLRDEMAAAAKAGEPKNGESKVQSATPDSLRKRYKAQFATEAREYQHEHKAAQQARLQMRMASDGLKAPQGQEKVPIEGLRDDDLGYEAMDEEVGDDEDEDEDGSEVEMDWACMPVKLSICLSLPLHEHEEPLNFARMSLWTRVEELDVFVAVPSEVPRCLEILSSLIGSPLRKFRFSSIYASVLVDLPTPVEAALLDTDSSTATRNGQGRIRLLQPEVNIAAGLEAILQNERLRVLLLSEFNNHRVPDVRMLESALADAIASSPNTSTLARDEQAPWSRSSIPKTGQNGELAATKSQALSIRARNGLPHRSTDTLTSSVNVRILQGNQGHFGKLKDRRQDFLVRALGTGLDCWAQNRV